MGMPPYDRPHKNLGWQSTHDQMRDNRQILWLQHALAIGYYDFETMQTAGKVKGRRKERVMRYDSEVKRKDPDLMKGLVFGIQGCGQLTFHDLETRRQACPESGGISIFQAPNRSPQCQLLHPPSPSNVPVGTRKVWRNPGDRR